MQANSSPDKNGAFFGRAFIRPGAPICQQRPLIKAALAEQISQYKSKITRLGLNSRPNAWRNYHTNGSLDVEDVLLMNTYINSSQKTP